jgi:hypothetical protein
VIGDLPVITPGAGAVRLVVDNDGQVTEVDDTTRAVDALSDRPRARISEPTPPGAAPSAGPTDYDAALARAFGRRLRRITMDGPAPLSFGVVPGTTEIGYDVQGSDAVVVAQRAVEVEFDGGFRKRYWVKAPLFG